MNLLDVAIAIFILLEFFNVLIIYFKPDFKYGNGMVVFKHWHMAKSDENNFLFVKYMASWVAGTKLIFIVLLLVILFTASEETKLYAIIFMIPAVATFYIGLFPLIERLDKNGQIQPKGYSKTLFFMITGFIVMFIIALAAYLI